MSMFVPTGRSFRVRNYTNGIEKEGCHNTCTYMYMHTPTKSYMYMYNIHCPCIWYVPRHVPFSRQKTRPCLYLDHPLKWPGPISCKNLGKSLHEKTVNEYLQHILHTRSFIKPGFPCFCFFSRHLLSTGKCLKGYHEKTKTGKAWFTRLAYYMHLFISM